MKLKLLCLPLLLAFTVCGPHRIPKMPVPQEDLIQSYRLMAQGDELLTSGKTHLALLKYLEASRLNPYHEVIFNKLAIAYSRLQRFQPAEQAIRRSIGLNPDYAFAYNTQGIIYLAMHNDGGAIQAFRKAIDLRSDEANFHVNLGYAYIREGEYEEALKSYRKALEIDPEILKKSDFIELPPPQEEGPDPERLFLMARLFAQLGNKDASLDYLGKALSAGFSDWNQLMNDPAFEELHEDPDFIRLISLYRQ